MSGIGVSQSSQSVPDIANRHDEGGEATGATASTPTGRQPGSLFLRHLQSSLRAANSFSNNVQAGAMADELRAYFPNLQPGRRAMVQPPQAATSATATTGARPARRPRRHVRASHDRRRSSCIRIRMTALDSPHIVSTSNLNLEALKGKGLGRPDNSTELVPLTWRQADFYAHARTRFPVLQNLEFVILRGATKSSMVEIPDLTGTALKTAIPDGSYVRLWIRPMEAITHVPMGTPTMLSFYERRPFNRTLQRTDLMVSFPSVQVLATARVIPEAGPSTARQEALPNPDDTVITLMVPNEEDVGPDSPPPVPRITPVPAVPGGQMTYVLPEHQGQPQLHADDTDVRVPSTETEAPVPSPEREPDSAMSTPEQPLHLVLDVTDEEGSIVEDLQELQRELTQTAFQAQVKRDNILEDVLDIYRNPIDMTLRLRVQFEGERGEDLGGLTKDLFSSFWLKAFEKYFKGENSCVPFLSLSNRHKAQDIFVTIGRIMEHMLRILGTIPAKFCRSAILAMANEHDTDEEMLLEDFLMYLPEADENLLKHCLQSAPWSPSEERRLLLFASVHNMNMILRPGNLRRSLLNMAQMELLDSCSPYLRMMYTGFSVSGKRFLRKLTPEGIKTLYASFKATSDKVAALIEKAFEEEDLSLLEQVMVNYVSNFVREMDDETLYKFLVWVTGSPTMPEEIKVAFNASSGLMRAPVAHTCGNILELSTDYNTYQEFRREFMAVLNNETAMTMNLL